ncbi:protein EFR3 homolog stmA isoform X1 [Rhodnius prolixus]|uniref:protein EFR3 homolog stmA isoform X1 n=1 Tax=Rhodnius prolixus TaxID=13249 RepID=UPI003D18F002
MSIVSCCFDTQTEIPDCLDSMLQKCSHPGCCFSCTCVRPRYKRLVDNIFPQVPQDGLVKSNMEKLTFYSLSSPEKLDRIAEYLFQRASRDMSRKKTGYVVMAMEAMDQLLLACHAQTLNLFVESFLRMIQKLLESTEPDLQILATQSFVNFANIEEDTPSYHRRYDFFVSKFSSMCHSNHSDPNVRTMIRMAGIKGLQGVIRKTVSDDLVENIWEPIHMDKILPSLLFNMQDSKYYKEENYKPGLQDKNDPGVLADTCIRELIGRASFGHVRSVLRPVLRHLDLHNLWVPNDFAIHTFRIIMFSIQSQYSYAVVESLMSHLDENSGSSARIRTSITHVLSKIISISAEESVGPSVLEIINSLLGHVRVSASRRQDAEETQYMEALISCLGEFTAHLPDYQKVEIMVFIISKIPGEKKPPELLLQEMLLKSLLIVCKKYTNVSMNTTFPVSLLEPLLRLCANGETVFLVQSVLHQLLDRHANLSKVHDPSLDHAGIVREQCSRSDTMFLRKYGDDIYTCLVDSLHITCSLEILQAIYSTLALIAIELVTITTLPSFLAMVYSLQEFALSQNNLSVSQKCNVHILAICLLNLVSNLLQIPSMKVYVQSVIDKRREIAPYLLPEIREEHRLDNLDINPDLLILEVKLGECLRQSGVEVPTISASLVQRHSWVENTGMSMKGSNSDLTTLDLDSANSTPGIQRKYPEEELSFEAMKRVLAESSEVVKANEKHRQEQLFQTFRNTTFQEMVVRNTVKDEETLQSKLMELLNKTQYTPLPQNDMPPIYEQLFPELFAY